MKPFPDIEWQLLKLRVVSLDSVLASNIRVVSPILAKLRVRSSSNDKDERRVHCVRWKQFDRLIFLSVLASDDLESNRRLSSLILVLLMSKSRRHERETR